MVYLKFPAGTKLINLNSSEIYAALFWIRKKDNSVCKK